MNKLMFLFSFMLLFILKGYSQSGELKKYTYLIFCTYQTDTVLGAGFFIRYKHKLFFVTAEHVASLCKGKEATIVLNRINNTTATVDISRVKKGKALFDFGEKDIFISEVKINKEVYSIEKFIGDYREIDKTLIAKVIFWGFPKTENESKFDFKKTFPKFIKSEDSLIGKYDRIRFSPTVNKFDSVNYLFKHFGEGEGYSGAPMFFWVKNRFLFGGMLTSGNPDMNVGFGLRPEVVLREIEKYSISLANKPANHQ